MSNIDLINAYFGNEMTPGEREEFEISLQKDVELKKEFDFQKEIIQAIKATRKAELKAMLDKVPVSGGQATGLARWGKAASVIAIVGLAALGVYLWVPNEPENKQPSNDQISVIQPAEEETGLPEAPGAEDSEQPVEAESQGDPNAHTPVEEPLPEDNQQQPGKDIPSEPEINKPDPVPAFDTQEQMVDSLKAPGNNLASQSYNDPASLEVEIDNDNKKLNFHYRFKDGKLFLFGAFDQGLYEILEINEEQGKTLFLYYKDKFYHLSTGEDEIVPLEPVQKPSLVEKLKQIREHG